MDGNEFFIQISSWMYTIEEGLGVFATSLVSIVVAAGVIYTTFLAWRKYRAATNRV